MTQSIDDPQPQRARRPVSAQDVWLQWPDLPTRLPNLRPTTIGVLGRGCCLAGGLRIHTVAPCGCDVSEHTQALQAAAVQAGAIT